MNALQIVVGSLHPVTAQRLSFFFGCGNLLSATREADLPFSYQAEKFAIARRRLMLPHPNGEPASIVSAFHECSQGLHGLDQEKLDDKARRLLAQLTVLMDTSDVVDPHERGPWTVKATTLTAEQKFEMSRVIDELAGWFAAYQRRK
jgi:hypothetical protein